MPAVHGPRLLSGGVHHRWLFSVGTMADRSSLRGSRVRLLIVPRACPSCLAAVVASVLLLFVTSACLLSHSVESLQVVGPNMLNRPMLGRCRAVGPSLIARHCASTTNMEAPIVHTPSAPRVLLEKDGPTTRQLVWDENKGAYLPYEAPVSENPFLSAYIHAKEFLRHSFVPDDVSRDYFSFTRWRCTQRFIAATVNVFGTQALLLALGIKSRGLGATAAMTWVLKDALAKVGRIAWAGKMGRRFDADAKRWRFRSSLLYASGSGLEIVTYIFPASFLLLATSANALKQMSMLTSSATRNTIYRSFALGENIGDITAKGEAQIAVVDMLGILSGICLSKAVGTSRLSIGLAYLILTLLDICAIYRENRSVVFTTLNYERASLLIDDFVSSGEKLSSPDKADPQSISKREHIFLPSRRSPNTFRTVSGAGLSAPLLAELSKIFQGDKFLLAHTRRKGLSIVLHTSAGGQDTLKSLMALRYMEEAIRLDTEKGLDVLESEAILRHAKQAQLKASESLEDFLTVVGSCGWFTHKFMFGNIRRRSDWHLFVS